MSFLFSSPWRCDAFSLFPSINPAYGLQIASDVSQETQSTEGSKDLDDQIFGRNAYSPTPASLGDVMDTPSSSSSPDSFDSPSSILICPPTPEPEPFWLAGIDDTAASPIEDFYLQLEIPCDSSTNPYKIESLFEDEADRGIHVLDVFTRESSLEVPLADSIGSALFNTHKAPNYHLQASIPPSPSSSINSSLPSPASSPQSLSDRSELPSPISPGLYPPLSPSGKSECSSPASLDIRLPPSPSGQTERPSPLSPAIHPPLSPSRRQPLTSSSSPPSLSTTNQMRRPRIHTQASSAPSPTFPRIQPYVGDLPAGPESPVHGKVMSELERRVIVTILQATKTFGEWDFVKCGLPPLEKEAVSTQKARKCGEDRRNQTSCKEIRCLIPGCGANLTALHNLKSHISSHYGVRDWVCETCKSCFSHSGSLARHKKEFCTAEEGQSLSQKRNSQRRNETRMS